MTLLHNARLWDPTVAASPGDCPLGSVRIDGGRYGEIDPQSMITPRAGEESCDLEGRFLVPAFCDAHVHLHHASLRHGFLELPNTQPPDRFAAQIGCHGEEGWILGGGWRAPQLDRCGGAPLELLDRCSPRRPLFLWSADYHCALINSAAAEVIGLDLASAPTPGVLREREAELAWELVPVPAARLGEQIADLHRHGIAAIGCFEGKSSLDTLTGLDRAGELPLRVCHSLPWEAALAGASVPEPGSRLQVGWVKLFFDGALGSRTAWMFEDYDNDPGNRGVQRLDSGELQRGLGIAIDLGLAVAMHAIGDAAVAAAVDAAVWIREERRRRRAPEPRCRAADRIEHAQLLTPETLARIISERPVLSVQPCHLLEDIKLAPDCWGTRCEGMLPLRTLLEAGVPLAFGTDFPIESIDPWLNIHAARERTDRAGNPPGGWVPEQKIGFRAAFAAATAVSGASSGMPVGWGRLQPGSPADFQVLECSDPCAVRSVDEAGLAALYLAGEPVWTRGDR